MVTATGTVTVTDSASLSAALSNATADVIVLAAGSYAGDFTVSRGVTIRGANQGVAGTGTRVAETILTGSWAIQATDQVKIDGVKFADTQAVTANAGDNFRSLTISGAGDVAVTNSVFAREPSGYDAGFNATSFRGSGSQQTHRAVEISNVTASHTVAITDNMFTAGNAYSYAGDSWRSGVYSNGGAGTTNITGNTFQNVRSGVNADNFSPTVHIDNNTFQNGAGASAQSGTGVSFGVGSDMTSVTTVNNNKFGANLDGEFNLKNVATATNFDPVAAGNTLIATGATETYSIDGTGGAAAFAFKNSAYADKFMGNSTGDSVTYSAAALTAANFSIVGGAWAVTSGGKTDNLIGVEKVVDSAGKVFLLAGATSSYTTLTAALAAAPAGATILANGTFNEALTVATANVTIQGVGTAMLKGTFKTANGLADTASVADFLKTAVTYNAGGTGVQVRADGLTIKDLAIDGFTYGVHINNPGVTTNNLTISNVTFTDNVVGVEKATTAGLSNFKLLNGSMSDGYIGVDFAKDTTSASSGLATGVTIDGTNFSNIDQKGIYAEALSDANLTNLVMSNVGQYGGGPAFGAAGANGNAININLKAGTYSNITIDKFTLTNTGTSNGLGNSHVNSGAIAINVRSDAPNYSTVPATATNIVVKDGTINGTSTGIRVGEPNKASPNSAVAVTNVSIYNAQHTGAFGDVVNESASVLTVTGTAGNDTLTAGTAQTAGAIVFNGGGGVDVLTGANNSTTFNGGAGNDTLVGGTGLDVARYTTLPTTGITYDSASNSFIVNAVAEGVDSLKGIEQISTGSGAKILLAGGGSNYATVQQAFNDAVAGDKIIYAPGVNTAVSTPNAAITITAAGTPTSPTGAANVASPVFTSGATASIAEGRDNDTTVYAATATDADNDTLSYSLSGGVDMALFNVNPTTGAVSFKASPAFDRPKDVGADNVYNIVVQASDGVPSHNVTKSVAITVTDDPNVTSAPAVVTGTTTVDGGGTGSTITGDIINTGTVDFTKPSDVTFSGTISGSGSLEKEGSGTLTLNGDNTYTGETKVEGGTLLVNGSISNSTVNVGNGANLGGSGSTGPVNLSTGGSIGAGNSPGTLSTGSLSLVAGSTFKQEIAGYTAGQYDVVNVTGTVALNGATLNTSLFGGFVPFSNSTPLVIINNDGTDAVTGTFAGLAEGASFTLGPAQVKISYVGGTGNDVTLQVLLPSGGGGGGGGGGSTPPTTTPTPSGGQGDTQTNASTALGVELTSSKALAPTVLLADGSTVVNPLFQQAQQVATAIQKFNTGAFTKAQLIVELADIGGATSGVAVEAYQFFTGKTPTKEGMAYLIDSTANPNDLTDAYYAKFNETNRFINFAVNLGTGPGAGAAQFNADYGSLTFEASVRKAYEAIIGSAAAVKAGINVDAAVNYVVSQFSYFRAVAGSDIGAKAAMVGYLLAAGNDAHVGTYYNATLNFTTHAFDGDAQYNVNLVGVYGG